MLAKRGSNTIASDSTHYTRPLLSSVLHMGGHVLLMRYRLSVFVIIQWCIVVGFASLPQATPSALLYVVYKGITPAEVVGASLGIICQILIMHQ